MQIYIGADHRGFKLAEELLIWGKENKLPIENVGAFVYNKEDDYVDFARLASEKVMADIVAGNDARGIVVCGTGVGVDIVANKKRFIRCCLGFNEEQVRKTRHDDNVNFLALPADFVDISLAKTLVNIFLQTPFSMEGKYSRRIAKIGEIRPL
ncbi:MAG TPA: RpiB/LacA/LacB family sugar-phosphate isomerase [Patescibacteria group bacterium]|nr:RpiB/LacA/LacB family sugar-phosphate isomerase [Patescibacteria group bacterium]